jgi:hypothetical protein
VVIWLFYVFWSIYRYFGDFRGMHFDNKKKKSLGGILVVLEV